MPGSSLWLVPPEDSELYKTIHDLIVDQVPSVFPGTAPPQFAPHVTLAADVVLPDHDSSELAAQQWLNSIDLPADAQTAEVRILDAEAGSVFFKKITMGCEKTAELCHLAACCRTAGVPGLGSDEAKKWAKEEYRPHCSLMYSDLPEDDVRSKLDKVNERIVEAKQQRRPQCGRAIGGSIWLVPTYKPIEEWKPVAVRHLPEAAWTWKT